MEKSEISKCNRSKERWAILRNFIKNQNLDVQHKRSHAYGLFTSYKITDLIEAGYEVCNGSSKAKSGYEWLEYASEHFPSCRLAVRQRIRAVNWNDATGFDNTGNICVWPSEEVLSYICIKNSEDFRGKTVCELGAGMTGLAGMMLAIASDVQEILITDGNMDGVSNLKEIARTNKRQFGGSKAVNVRQLRWNMWEDYSDLKGHFDFVLCSDCLLYEQLHASLADVISTLLKPDGMVLMTSPRRGCSVEQFIEQAKTKCFDCECIENYDEFVWSAYCQEKEGSPLAEVVRNFPVLIKMKKKK
ncbi:calmodulin-lysine N-methyltransferase-like [Dendronephthya gigantea]|uniref:calmodulin-lysine N-methyltransferase-like n=1 Tax=Dendronephthya gigantea TaxID=151771 RepID=UPI00106BAEF6|nr:calmodulin-lysine N-methyltransferase-like [Dendronephthya gigantea]